MRRAQIHADAYKPTPYTVCVTTLRNRATFGRGVLDAAIPAPIAGCIRKNGATSVAELTIKGGINVGRRSSVDRDRPETPLMRL